MTFALNKVVAFMARHGVTELRYLDPTPGPDGRSVRN